MTVRPETSRVAKVLVDAGHGSFTEVQERLGLMTLSVHLSEANALIPAAQAAALTIIVTAARCFLGGVTLTGAVNTPLIVKLPVRATTVGEAAIELGAKKVHGAKWGIVVGNDSAPSSGWAIRAWWDGWLAGVRPAGDAEPTGRGENPLAGVAAGALAVTQAFLSAQGDLLAGKKVQTVSLWSPGDNVDVGPETTYLPRALWLIGLGNLGQAYLWSLAMLPYSNPSQVEIFLQDFDTVKDVNWGTSILVPEGYYGALKTKMAEDWAIARGFKVRRLDRRFDKNTIRADIEPPVALAGLDKVEARKLLSGGGFEFIIDCGLGATARDYRKIRMNVFDNMYRPDVHFKETKENNEVDVTARNLRLQAYQREMANNSSSACGMAEIAGASAAVPFVSAFAGALALTQAIRVSSGERPCRTLVGSVEDVRALRVAPGGDLSPVQVGYSEPMQISHSSL